MLKNILSQRLFKLFLLIISGIELSTGFGPWVWFFWMRNNPASLDGFQCSLDLWQIFGPRPWLMLIFVLPTAASLWGIANNIWGMWPVAGSVKAVDLPPAVTLGNKNEVAAKSPSVEVTNALNKDNRISIVKEGEHQSHTFNPNVCPQEGKVPTKAPKEDDDGFTLSCGSLKTEEEIARERERLVGRDCKRDRDYEIEIGR